MKQFLLISFVALLFACNDDKPVSPPDDNISTPKEYTVTLGMTGELSMETSPLGSKAAPANIYGIQVYSRPVDNSGKYEPCAYGLFDNKDNMSIKLLEGNIYKFVATMVGDGVNVVNHNTVDGKTSYSFPFCLTGSNMGVSPVLKNMFQWDRTNY